MMIRTRNLAIALLVAAGTIGCDGGGASVAPAPDGEIGVATRPADGPGKKKVRRAPKAVTARPPGMPTTSD